MGTQGVFGYILGKKKRYMHIQFDANIAYNVLIRELYILIKHFGDVDKLKEEFDKIKNGSGIPTKQNIDKTKYYSNFNVSMQSTYDWYCLLKYCQMSFINIIDCGFMLNCRDEYGYIFTLNFNTNRITFKNNNRIIYDHDIYDIFKMDNMPQITYDEIIHDVRLEYNIIKEKIDEKKDIINKILIEYPQIERLLITKKTMDSTDPLIIKLVEKKILYDECNYDINKLTNEGYDFNKRLKALLL